jgi:hypothetical protein
VLREIPRPAGENAGLRDDATDVLEKSAKLRDDAAGVLEKARGFGMTPPT